jgi:hypothetical protein
MLKRILRIGLWGIAGVLALALLNVWGVYGWAPIPQIRGGIAARIDVKHGHFKELGYGLPVPWRPAYERLLRKRYGIEFETVAGCLVSPYLEKYVVAYNEVSEGAVNRKFGHDVFKELLDEASSDWKRAHHSTLKDASALRN